MVSITLLLHYYYHTHYYYFPQQPCLTQTNTHIRSNTLGFFIALSTFLVAWVWEVHDNIVFITLGIPILVLVMYDLSKDGLPPTTSLAQRWKEIEEDSKNHPAFGRSPKEQHMRIKYYHGVANKIYDTMKEQGATPVEISNNTLYKSAIFNATADSDLQADIDSEDPDDVQ